MLLKELKEKRESTLLKDRRLSTKEKERSEKELKKDKSWFSKRKVSTNSISLDGDWRNA